MSQRVVILKPDVFKKFNKQSISIDDIKNHISSILQIIEHGLKAGDTIKLELHSKKHFNHEKKTVLYFPTFQNTINHKFAIYFRLLKLIYIQLCNNSFISKRQIYYMDVKLFKRQYVINNCIDILSSSLGLSIEQLKIHASQKGLIYANLSIQNKNNSEKFVVSREMGSCLIPLISLDSKIDDFIFSFNFTSNEFPKCIIIVEKDSILSALIDREKINADKLFNDIILITGRGFPDRLTKHFVYLLCKYFNNSPIYGFFDCDVFGFMIAMEYKLKAYNQSNQPCCPNLKIKGSLLFPSNIINNLKLDYIPINNKDITFSISQFIDFNKTNNQLNLLKELQRSLFFLLKRETQIEDVINRLQTIETSSYHI